MFLHSLLRNAVLTDDQHTQNIYNNEKKPVCGLELNSRSKKDK